MAKTIDRDVLDVLQHCEFDDERLVLVGQLDRKLYQRTNKVIEQLGGKWNRKAKAHLFDGVAAEICADAISSGEYEYVDEKQKYQFFETPRSIADDLVNRAGVGHGMKVLEPSAGRGAIAEAIDRAGGEPFCVELQAKLVVELERWHCIHGNFLDIEPVETYDAVVMNPPFTRSQDIAHVRHAFRFLKPSARLVAVMSLGFTFRTDQRAQDFRDWLAANGGSYSELPEGSFRESGTGVRTVVVEVRK